MRARAAVSLGVALASSSIAACKSDGPAPGDAGAASTAPSTPSTTLEHPTHDELPAAHPPVPKQAPLPCRVLAVSGAVAVIADVESDGGVTKTDAGAPGVGSTVPRGATIVLGPAAKVSLKSPKTGRELSFAGPGEVRGCMGDDDDAWIARGTFTSVPGTGEGPGAEQWVVTPLGAIRYAGGALSVRVADGKTDVDVTTGARVFAFAAKDATDAGDAGSGSPSEDGWDPVSKGHPWSRSAKPAGVRSAKLELDVCREGAASARSLAAAMSFPDADLTVDAPAHIAARRAARASCAVAGLRIAWLPPSPDREALGRSYTSGGDWSAPR